MDQKYCDDEIDLRKYIEVIARGWKTIVILSLLISIIAYVKSSSQQPVYESRTKLYFRNGTASGISQYAGMAGLVGISGKNDGAENILELLKTRKLAEKVLIDLQLNRRIVGWNDPKIKRSSLADAVKTMVLPPKINGNIVEIIVNTGDRELSADLVNSYVRMLGEYWSEINYSETQNKINYIFRELPRAGGNLINVENKLKLYPQGSTGYGEVQRDYDIYNSVYTMLRKELEAAKLDESKNLPPFSILDEALVPDSPIKPNVKLSTIVGLVIGLGFGVFIAVFMEYWRNTSSKVR